MNENMSGALDISWLKIAVGYLVLVLPFLMFRYYKLTLIKSSLWAVIRMSLQLYLLGFYLEYIFVKDHVLLNVLWIVAMVIISVLTTIKKSEVLPKYYFMPLLISVFLSLSLTLLYFIAGLLGFEYFFNARYLIPIVGIILGNSINSNIVAIHGFNSKLKSEYHLYQYALANGATRYDALLPFITHGMKQALNPMIAMTAVVGLISIPGMMTGQILGGSSPLLAIKYQIVTMVSIFFAVSVVVVLTLNLSIRFIFTKYGNLKY